MDEKIARTISGLKDWNEHREFTKNVISMNRLTSDVKEALDQRLVELGRELVSQKTGLDLTSLSEAEEKIVLTVSHYVALKKIQSSHASRTFEQLRNRGLIGAAETSVCKSSPTEGLRTFTATDHSEVSYEQIVIDHPDDFSERTQWYARRALGMPNYLPNPPAQESSDTQTKTTEFITWLKNSASDNDGIIPAFTNEQSAAAIGLDDMRKYGRAHGNIQSRIDFACYRAKLPPLGLASDKQFDLAWAQEGREWAYPVIHMQRASRNKEWKNDDFNRILQETLKLPAKAHLIWKNALAKEEQAIRDWAFSFATDVPSDAVIEERQSKRNTSWSRDELILALDLYIRHRASPLPKGSPDIEALSNVLNQLGIALGQRTGITYRNGNGVYMKLMNFRRLDPNYTESGKKGLSRGNQDEVFVWNQFSHDEKKLSEVAQFIRQGITEDHLSEGLAGPDEPGIEEAEEGKVATRVHRYRERDRRLVVEAKTRAMKQHGRLACAACGFDFFKKYGEIGINIIDVHHTKPVHTMKPGEKTNVADLVLLCSNCHRLVHSRRAWLSVDQVKEAFEKGSANG